MTFEEWKESRHMNGIYWGDLKAAWDASRNAALDEVVAMLQASWFRTQNDVEIAIIELKGDV